VQVDCGIEKGIKYEMNVSAWEPSKDQLKYRGVPASVAEELGALENTTNVESMALRCNIM